MTPEPNEKKPDTHTIKPAHDRKVSFSFEIEANAWDIFRDLMNVDKETYDISFRDPSGVSVTLHNCEIEIDAVQNLFKFNNGKQSGTVHLK